MTHLSYPSACREQVPAYTPAHSIRSRAQLYQKVIGCKLMGHTSMITVRQFPSQMPSAPILPS